MLKKIVKMELIDRYYCNITLECGHKKEISRQAYKKYKDGKVSCYECKR